MERVDTLMQKLGFNTDAEDSVKAAFIKNLIKQAYGVEVEIPPQYQQPPDQTFDQFAMTKLDRHILDPRREPSDTQLSFNLDAVTPPAVAGTFFVSSASSMTRR